MTNRKPCLWPERASCVQYLLDQLYPGSVAQDVLLQDRLTPLGRLEAGVGAHCVTDLRCHGDIVLQPGQGLLGFIFFVWKTDSRRGRMKE